MSRTSTVATLLLGTVMVFLQALSGAESGATGGSSLVEAPQQEHSVELPRSFQGMRLGMPRAEAVKASQHGALNQSSTRDVLRVAGKDRYIKEVAYRFHSGVLYQIQTHYRGERIPGGVEGLVGRLKEAYGRPIVDGAMTFAPDRGVLSETRTVWRDGRTEIVFLERESHLQEAPDLILEMTDLEVGQMKQRATREQQRQQMREIPIPLPERGVSKNTAAVSPGPVDGPRVVARASS